MIKKAMLFLCVFVTGSTAAVYSSSSCSPKSSVGAVSPLPPFEQGPCLEMPTFSEVLYQRGEVYDCTADEFYMFVQTFNAQRIDQKFLGEAHPKECQCFGRFVEQWYEQNVQRLMNTFECVCVAAQSVIEHFFVLDEKTYHQKKSEFIKEQCINAYKEKRKIVMTHIMEGIADSIIDNADSEAIKQVTSMVEVLQKK